MRILLDENLDWRLERDLAGHDVSSVPKIGWTGIKNGELLRRAEEQFDVLITMDSGLGRFRTSRGVILFLYFFGRAQTVSLTRGH